MHKAKKTIDSPLNRLLFYLKETIEKLVKDKRVIAITILVLILLLYYGQYFKQIFFVTVLTLLGAFSTIYLRYVKEAYVLGVELCMFATVMCARVYGPATGAFVGFTTIFLSLIVGGRFKYSSFISVLALPLIGFIAPAFGSWSIETQGIVLTIIYDLIIIPLYILLGSKVISSVIFLITHIVFNYWVFRDIAPILLRIMG